MERLEGRRAGRIRERGCHSVLDQPCRLVLVRRAAPVECDRRALLLEEQPRWPAECLGHRAGEHDGRGGVPFVAALANHGQALRPTEPGEGACLEAMVAHVADAADAHPRGKVGHRPARDDRDDDAAIPVSDPRDPAERPAGEGLDLGSAPEGDARSRDRCEGPVEVADDQQRPARRENRPKGLAKLVDRASGLQVGIRQAGGQGLTVTPGRIFPSPCAMMSPPMPP